VLGIHMKATCVRMEELSADFDTAASMHWAGSQSCA